MNFRDESHQASRTYNHPNGTNLFEKNVGFLRPYAYYIHNAVYDIQNHIYAFHGISLEKSELRQAALHVNHWRNWQVLEALEVHGWPTTALFLELLELLPENPDGIPWNNFRRMELNERYLRFRKDLNQLNDCDKSLENHKAAIVFAMTKAFWRLNLDEIEDFDVEDLKN